jgi:type II secretory pathway component PulM
MDERDWSPRVGLPDPTRRQGEVQVLGVQLVVKGSSGAAILKWLQALCEASQMDDVQVTDASLFRLDRVVTLGEAS